MKSVLSCTTPLCFLFNNQLLCYKKGKILVVQDDLVKKEYPILANKKERMFGWNRLALRLFRFGVRAAIEYEPDHVLLSVGNSIFELDLNKSEVSKGWCCDGVIRPLVMSLVNNIAGFEDGVYFGGYLHNKEKNPVNVYHRVGVDKWNVVYTFPQGAINHVHNIVPDPYRQCLWVFTGDFDDAAAIWKISDGFRKVERFAFGDQKWRGCVAFATPNGLLYATDTPFSDNHVFLMKEDGSLETIANLSGSCIYGCQWKGKFVFSSTVEADGRDESFLKLLFSKKRGAGIVDDYVRLYIGDCYNGFKEMYKEKKDCLPFIFQFGVFKFPAGVNKTNMLYFQPVATKKNDLKLLGLGLE